MRIFRLPTTGPSSLSRMSRITSFSMSCNAPIQKGLWYDTRFVRLQFEGKRVTGLEAERQGLPVHITARLIVGADGALSNVRQSLGIAAEMHLYPEAYVIAILDSSSEVTEAKYFVGNRSILGMFPAAGRKVYLFYMIPAGSFET